MERLIFFGILSIPVIIISWRALFNIKNHGFYRFFSWECIIWLFVTNYTFWFDDPFGIRQIFSWIFLLFSGYLIIDGVILIKKIGKPGNNRDEKSLYHLEKTSTLIDIGIFKYIRHPLYSSLLFFTWGVFLKNVTISLFFVGLLSTAFLYLTAIFEEKECIEYFGKKYSEYMKRSKMFIPFIL
ncbi:MAG: methyltransferase [Bacteroidales bacterium]|jgi:protein-S-isoprenylcysteine O-methyltransferase Ste14